MTGGYRRQLGTKTGKPYAVKYRILAGTKASGSAVSTGFWCSASPHHLQFGNVHRLKKVEISFLDNDLTDSIEVISQEKLDFCHIN